MLPLICRRGFCVPALHCSCAALTLPLRLPQPLRCPLLQVKQGVAAAGVLQALYKHTKLQSSFSCNMVALVDGSPKQLALKDFLVLFLAFR